MIAIIILHSDGIVPIPILGVLHCHVCIVNDFPIALIMSRCCGSIYISIVGDTWARENILWTLPRVGVVDSSPSPCFFLNPANDKLIVSYCIVRYFATSAYKGRTFQSGVRIEAEMVHETKSFAKCASSTRFQERRVVVLLAWSTVPNSTFALCCGCGDGLRGVHGIFCPGSTGLCLKQGWWKF